MKPGIAFFLGIQAHLRSGRVSADLSSLRQGEASSTTGSLPPSASRRAGEQGCQGPGGFIPLVPTCLQTWVLTGPARQPLYAMPTLRPLGQRPPAPMPLPALPALPE